MSNIITINGKWVRVPSGNITVINDQIFVDGEPIDIPESPDGIVEIRVEGDLLSVHSDVAVTCHDVHGDVKAGSAVNCQNVEGNVQAGSVVNCDRVNGSVSANVVNHV